MNLFASLQDWYDRRREFQRQLDWRAGFLTAIGTREFAELPPLATDQHIAESSEAFKAGYLYGSGCSLAVGAPDDRKTQRGATPV